MAAARRPTSQESSAPDAHVGVRDDGDRRPGLGEPERNGLADASIACGADCDLPPQRELVEYRHH
jgi:hypothetical protein